MALEIVRDYSFTMSGERKKLDYIVPFDIF